MRRHEEERVRLMREGRSVVSWMALICAMRRVAHTYSVSPPLPRSASSTMDRNCMVVRSKSSKEIKTTDYNHSFWTVTASKK